MTTRGPLLTITKPVAVWNKPLKTNFVDLFKGLSKAAVHGVTGNWREMTAEACDAIAAIGLDTKPDELAWILIRRSITNATYSIVSEFAVSVSGSVPEPEEFYKQIELTLEGKSATISRKFFDTPKEIEILSDLQSALEAWLRHRGLSAAQAKAVADRLPHYFTYALHDEWRRGASDYVKIKEALDTPFARAAEMDMAWMAYGAYLNRKVYERMFDEAFCLLDVYVQPRAYFEVEFEGGDTETAINVTGRKSRVKRIIVDLTKELTSWIKTGNKDDAIRLISGGPGCGKSSFTKVFASQLSNAGHNVLLIPMHLFNPTADLERGVVDFVSTTQILPGNPLDTDKIIIIFDGLDELAMQGRVAAEIARDFVHEVGRFVHARNLKKLRVQVVISGRELVIQSTRAELRKPRQVLSFLSYHLAGRDGDLEQYEGPQTLLHWDQRDEWWRKYGAVTQKGYMGIPKDLARPDLVEVTSQPLLNYLVALSFSRGTIDFSRDVNLNQIYKDLLAAVHERSYAEAQHPGVRDMALNDFVRVLEEIGLAAWKGDGRTTTVREIESHCKEGGLVRLLDRFQEGATKGATRLLTAFYFRQHGYRQDGDRTFEFTHKSFGEYLTACRLLRAVRRISDQLKRRKDNPDDGWDEREALKHWAEVCGPTAVDAYLFRFFKDEIVLAGPNDAQQWQHAMTGILNHMLRSGMPMDHLSQKLSYQESVRQARNAEESLLACLYACATVTDQLSHIQWPNLTTAGVWISRLRGQRVNSSNPVALQSLGRLNLDGCVLYMQDLFSTNLRGASLIRTMLDYAIIAEADISNADFTEAQMFNVRMNHVTGSGCKLTRARLHRADLERADLSFSDLRGAGLESAVLLHASFRGSDLREARMSNANLQHVNFSGADLRGAIFTGARQAGINLTGAKIDGAIGLKSRQT